MLVDTQKLVALGGFGLLVKKRVRPGQSKLLHLDQSEISFSIVLYIFTRF